MGTDGDMRERERAWKGEKERELRPRPPEVIKWLS